MVPFFGRFLMAIMKDAISTNKVFLLEKSLKQQLKNLGLVWIRYKMDLEQIHCNDVLHGSISEQHVLRTFTCYIICYFYKF